VQTAAIENSTRSLSLKKTVLELLNCLNNTRESEKNIAAYLIWKFTNILLCDTNEIGK